MLAGPLAVGASPNPWPFDFDSQISADPAYVDQQIDEFSAGLPGVPATPMTEVTTGDVRLYFYPEMADAFFRARDSGPGFADLLVRDPLLCQQHGNFNLPSLTLQSDLPICSWNKSQIEAVFVDHKNACLYVEFPEIYVLEYEAGPIPPSTLTSFEGLINLCGEALMHVDFQQDLFPPELITITRDVIAKLRYEALLAAIDSQRLAYTQAQETMDGAPTCFDAAEVNALSAEIDVLSTELTAAEQALISLYSDGLTQAALDLANLEAQGRVRDELLHPALSDQERLMLSFYIGGIYWRMRGAGLVAEPPDPGQGLLRRLYFVQYPYQLIGELNAGLTDAQNVGFNIFVQENWGYADWMDMGTSPGRDKYADLVDMTDRGREATLLVAPLLNQRGYDVRELVYGGLQMGPCYYYAWEELRNYQLGPDLQYPYMWFLECPTAVGEFCTGGSLALGLARTLLWGKPGAACEGDCTGKVCGDDGCGTSCGECDPGQACTQGVCQQCASDCTDKVCGDDGCGGSCGQCPQAELCQQGQCVCAPDCAGLICGDDGCGGSCGQCVGGKVCQQGQCVCVPDCTGKVCGDDGCGSACGTCEPGLDCIEGVCQQCNADCTGKDCGDDGCGNSCGTCEPGMGCIEGVCQQCSANCAEKSCGDDGCGGSCGTCPVDQICVLGDCVSESTDGGDGGGPCLGGDCDAPPQSDGCGCSTPAGEAPGLVFLGLISLLALGQTRKGRHTA